jgi:hypothetical protein
MRAIGPLPVVTVATFKVAVATGDALDDDALQKLAAGHHREGDRRR